ncbi:hypothetical protein BHY_0435 [Borrelia nietonii YOR]|uniref:Uncharacterized protein n=2 Tax=Borrelia TaxID=138 RepID=A0ABN4C3M1_9SPIR|nr:hypothetical protein BHY_0435 [Borrelia nietonii YOR]
MTQNWQKHVDMKKISTLKIYKIKKIIKISTTRESLNILLFMKYNFKNYAHLIRRHKLEEDL